MDPNKVVEHWGSVNAAAEALGVTDKAIYQWITAKRVPRLRQFQIAALTKGKVKTK